jgi:Outer membrane protein beta-barrel domain
MFVTRLIIVIALCYALEGAVAAQGMVVGSIGKVYGGDAQTSSGVFAIAVGGGGAHHIGSELEFSQASHFTDLDGNESRVLSLMASIFVSAPAGPVTPYGIFGIGFIRRRTESSTGFVLAHVSDDDVGYNAGGGVTFKFSRVAGVRVDVRHFKIRTAEGLSFQRVMAGIVLGR